MGQFKKSFQNKSKWERKSNKETFSRNNLERSPIPGNDDDDMDRIQALNTLFNTKSHQVPELSISQPRSRVTSPTSPTPARPASLPPPEIHVEYESEASDVSEDVEGADFSQQEGADSAKGQRHWLPAPEDLRPKKLTRSASIVSFVQVPGETKMRMIVSPDGRPDRVIDKTKCTVPMEHTSLILFCFTPVCVSLIGWPEWKYFHSDVNQIKFLTESEACLRADNLIKALQS